MLNLLYVLLALSVVMSLFGMVNTLVLSVFERTRELGMLRAVGMSRRQTRRMVRHESVITALIGAALGLPLGILLAAAVTHALVKYGVAFSLPGRPDRRLHGVGDPGRDPGGGRAGPPGLEAQRALGTAVRVAAGWCARGRGRLGGRPRPA